MKSLSCENQADIIEAGSIMMRAGCGFELGTPRSAVS